MLRYEEFYRPEWRDRLGEASMLHVVKQEPGDMPAIEKLLDEVFGPDRFSKASYLYRQNVPAIADLSWVAWEENRLVGTIRYWPIYVGENRHPGLLLGPIGIVPDRKGKGIGRALVYRTLELAIEMDYDLVLLVGDSAYFQRFGFIPASPLGFRMPGETRPHRLQVLELKDGILEKITGEIHPASPWPSPLRQ